jgi:hypothetical protein
VEEKTLVPVYIYEPDDLEWAVISLGHGLLMEMGLLRGLPQQMASFSEARKSILLDEQS